jgi:nickel superoxide dismutase
MKKNLRLFLLVIAGILFVANTVAAHCEIPCGIYDDEARITLLLEHVTTIEKSMQQIMTLEKKEKANSNQLIRWVMNKEHHAGELQTIVTQYFMTQRIKPDAKNYDKKIAALHQMLIVGMKCKQTTDLSQVAKLRQLLKEFQGLYFSGK